MKIFKKALIVVMVLPFYTTRLFSQTYSNKESSILSFTIGLTSSNLINNPVKYKSGIMFNGGFVYSLMLNDRLNVGIEALYTGKGFKADSSTIKYRHFYVDIPLYVQIKLGGNFRLNAGAQYSISTNSQIITLDNTKANGVRTDPIPTVKPMDYGFLLGAEFDLSKSISLGARYTVSGSLLFEKEKTNFGVFQLSIKYSPIKTYRVFFPKKEAK